MITASLITEAEVNHLRESGVKEILKKPVDMETLLAFLERTSKTNSDVVLKDIKS